MQGAVAVAYQLATIIQADRTGDAATTQLSLLLFLLLCDTLAARARVILSDF